MSNVADAKKRMAEIEKKLSDQQLYEKLKEEERLKLFQDYVLSMAQSNKEYHANEAKLAVQLRENLNNNPQFTDVLKKMAKIPYGPDTLDLLKETCVRDVVFQHMGLKSLSKHKTMDSETWIKTISELSQFGKDYVECREQMEEAIRKKDYDTAIKIGEDIIILSGRDEYQAKIQNADPNAEKTPEQKKIAERHAGFSRCIRNMMKYTVEPTVEKGENTYRGKITPESEQTIQEFLNRLAEIHIPDMFIMYEKGKEKTEELKKRNIPEISFMEEGKRDKFLNKLGRQVQKLQTPEGERFGARYMIFTNISTQCNAVKVNDQGIRMSNGKAIGNYPVRFLLDKATKVLSEKNMLEGNGQDAMDAATSLVANSDGRINDFYVIKQGTVPEGESMFLVIPKEVKRVLNMNSKEIFLREVEIDEGLKKSSEAANLLAEEIIPGAQKLYAEMERINPADKDSKAYQDMLEAVKNATRLGTKDFYATMVCDDNYGGFVPSRSKKTDEISVQTVKMAVRNVKSYLTQYRRNVKNRERDGQPVDHKGEEFIEKIEEFLWNYDKKVRYLPEISNSPTIKEEKRMLNIAKKNLNMGETAASEKLRVNILEDEFSKEIKKHMNAYNKASELHRCSSYYKKVEKEMDVFRQKYNTMLQIEKDLHNPKKPYEPGLNKKLIKAVKAVKESIAKVRKASDEYIEHKKSDKEYGPNAKQYSQDRVAAVEGIDYSMNWLDKVMDRKMDYVAMDATFYGYYDAMRRNIVRKLEKEQLPELTKVARLAVESMDKLCKMPNHYDTTPLTDEELQKYSKDIATIMLADYVNTKSGQKYIEEAKVQSGCAKYNKAFFQQLVAQVAESDAFKKALPKDLSRDRITKLITEGQEVHDLRGRFVTYMMREKNVAKEAARNAQNGMNQPVKGNGQPVNDNNNKPGGQPGNEELKNTELKQRPMGLH